MKLSRLVLSAFLSLSIFFSFNREAKAGLGLHFMIPQLVTIGAIAGGASAVTIGLTVRDIIKNGASRKNIALLILAIPVGLFGVTLLNEENATLRFSPLEDMNEARKIGLSQEEVLSFNEEIELVNIVVESVESEVAQLDEKEISKANEIWASHQDLLSPLTVSAMQKITNSIIKK